MLFKLNFSSKEELKRNLTVVELVNGNNKTCNKK